jgi:hypothetical protein
MSVDSQLTFWSNISPSSSGLKNRPGKKPAGSKQAWLFDPEDGGDMFLRNIRFLSTDYMVLYPRK